MSNLQYFESKLSINCEIRRTLFLDNFIFHFPKTKSRTLTSSRRITKSPFRDDDEESQDQEEGNRFFFPDVIATVLLNFLETSAIDGKAKIIYNGISLIKIYKPIVEKFLDINTPMKPFDETLNDKQLHRVLQNLCWLLIYDMIPEEFITEDFQFVHRSINENFSMNFAQVDKKIKNSKIIYSARFMELWSAVDSAAIITFLLSVFPNSELSNNIPFIVYIENSISKICIGIPPQNKRDFHKSVFGLVSKDILDYFPKFIIINEPEPQSPLQMSGSRTPNSARSIRKTTIDTKDARARTPQTSKQTPRRCTSYDRSGFPIAHAYEVYKKVDSIMNDYKVDRVHTLFDICAQEELYIEAKEVPPITPLGITFEDFPMPHLPQDYYNPRNPRRIKIKRVRTIKKPKTPTKHRYRVIPEPEETMATIAKAHDYLTDNPVF